MLIGFLWGFRNSKTTEAEFRIIEKYTLFLIKTNYISFFKLAFEGKVTFFPLQFLMYCSVVFIYD